MSFPKLVGLLVLLPAIIAYFHVGHRQKTSHVVVVTGRDEGSAGFENVEGIYRATSNSIYRHAATKGSIETWPSIGLVGGVIAPPNSGGFHSFLQLVVDVIDMHDEQGDSNFLQFDYKKKSWCISGAVVQLCAAGNGTRDFPTSGLYSNITLGTSVNVKYVAPEDKRKTPISIENEAMDAGTFIATKPATAILLALNLLSAYLYYSRKTPHPQVSIIYESIVDYGELWRIYTGSFAHFDYKHLGMNCLSLYSLGTELEESFGSIPFLFYNMALVPITICLTLYLTNLLRSGQTPETWRRQSTVGFSAVLFAWSTVAALRLPISWPLRAIFPNFTIKTYQLGRLKFNAGPLIRVAATSLLLPKSSMEGHLAGVISGLLLHWGYFPLWLAQPAVLVPALMLWDLRYLRKVLPIPTKSGIGDIHVRNLSEQKLVLRILGYLRNALVAATILSSRILERTLALQLLMVSLLTHFAIQSHAEELKASSTSEQHASRRRSGKLCKALLIACILSVLIDSATIGGLVVAKTYWSLLGSLQVWFGSAFSLLVARLFIQLLVITLMSKRTRDLGVMGGQGDILQAVFSGPLGYAYEAGEKWIWQLRK